MNMLFACVLLLGLGTLFPGGSVYASTVLESHNIHDVSHRCAQHHKRSQCTKHKLRPAQKAPTKKARRAVSQFRGGALDGTMAQRRASLAWENLAADTLKLPRFQTLDEIKEAIASGTLVRVPDESETFTIGYEIVLSEKVFTVDFRRRYLQSWTYRYLQQLSRDFMKEVGGTANYPKPKVTSMVRDLDYQLNRVKSVAKCNTPETCSTHLTGATFDISWKNMSRAQYKWMYARLTRDRGQGLINAIHEPWSGCFHIFVLPPNEKK